jgi:putative transposase
VRVHDRDDRVMIEPVTGEIIDQKELAERLLTQAKEQGVSRVGPGGLLNQLTRNVLETALEADLTEHPGHEHGRTPIAANKRNGTRSKTVLTEIGTVEIEVPRDRDGSFEPVIVPKRKRRLDGIDQIVLSLSARGLTTGESPRTSRRSTGPRSVTGRCAASRSMSSWASP